MCAFYVSEKQNDWPLRVSSHPYIYPHGPDDNPLQATPNMRWSIIHLGEQKWRSGESARLPPMRPWFDSGNRRNKSVELAGSLLGSERVFTGYSRFPLSPKTNI